MDLKARKDPVAWSCLLDELGDASEHLRNLVDSISKDPEYGDEEFQIDLGHVLAHLNRAWNSRHIERVLTDDEWNAFRRFPNDLDPLA